MFRASRGAFRFGDWVVDPDHNRISRLDERHDLEPLTMDVLVHIVTRADQVVSVGELLEQLWPDKIVEDGNVHRRIAKIRRALGDDPHDPTYIRTIVKRGYQAIAPVADAKATGSAPETVTRVSKHLGRPIVHVEVPRDTTDESLILHDIMEDVRISLGGAGLVTVADRAFSESDASPDGYHYIVRGDVRRRADTLRYSFEIVDHRSGTVIFSDRDETTIDLFARDQLGISDTIYWRTLHSAAHRSLAEVIRHPLDEWRAWQLLARFLGMDDSPEALDTIERASALEPDNHMLHLHLACQLAMQSLDVEDVELDDVCDRAIRHVRQANVAHTRSRHILIDACLVFGVCGRPDAGLALARRLQAHPPNLYASGVPDTIATALVRSGSFDEALQVVPGHRVALTALGRYEQALEIVTTRLQFREQDAMLWIRAANLYGHIGDASAGQSALETAQKLDPDWTPSHYARSCSRFYHCEEVAESLIGGLRTLGLEVIQDHPR